MVGYSGGDGSSNAGESGNSRGMLTPLRNETLDGIYRREVGKMLICRRRNLDSKLIAFIAFPRKTATLISSDLAWTLRARQSGLQELLFCARVPRAGDRLSWRAEDETNPALHQADAGSR